MKKLIIAIVILVTFLIILALAIGFALNSSRQSAENAARQENPLFHSTPEGGACRPDMGDCQTGLTCMDNICSKP